MDYIRFFLLTLCLSVWLVSEVTPLGEFVSTASPLNAANSSTIKEFKINSELTEDNLNANKTLIKEHKKDDSNTPKIRKVTLVDSIGTIDKKVNEKSETLVTATKKKSLTTTAATVTSAAKLSIINKSEGALLNVPVDNTSTEKKTIVENKDHKPILLASNTNTTANPTKSNNASDVKANVYDANNNSGIVDGVSKSTSSITKSSAGEMSSKIPSAKLSTKITTESTKAASTVASPSSTTSSTTTSSTTTTTTTTTTPKPKKPKITYGVEDFPDLDKESLAIHNLTKQQASSTSSSSSSSGKFPLPEAPYAQPSQEFTNTGFHGGRDYILPIVSMIFIIPLVIGILITTYRRFRDCWSTRHYRRMDFLVDGMYND